MGCVQRMLVSLPPDKVLVFRHGELNTNTPMTDGHLNANSHPARPMKSEFGSFDEYFVIMGYCQDIDF